MKKNTLQPNKKFLRYLLLFLLCTIYSVFFALSFFSKGIFLGGHFYRKSANLTAITYKAASLGAEYDSIVLKKYIDYCTIDLDDRATVTVYNDGSTHLDIHKSYTGQYSDEMWYAIATQQGETMRFFGKKPWFLPVAAVILLFVAKRYSTRLYALVFPHKAAGERWYLFVDRTFYICLVLGLLYLITPI